MDIAIRLSWIRIASRPGPRPPLRPEDDAPPPPADGEEVSRARRAEERRRRGLAGLGAVKNVRPGWPRPCSTTCSSPKKMALDDVLRDVGDEDGDGSPPGTARAAERGAAAARGRIQSGPGTARARRAGARGAEKRRQQPDGTDGFVLVRDLANPTGADPPVPPPEYCVVSIAAD